MHLASLPRTLVKWTLVASVAPARAACATAFDRTLRVAFASAETRDIDASCDVHE